MRKFFYAICLLQFCLIFILGANQMIVYANYMPENRYIIQNGIIIFLTLTTVVTIYMMLAQLKVYLKAKSSAESQSETIKNIQKFNLQLRAQRHDFINHIQIVYSLIEMDEFDEAKKYLQKVYGDLEAVNKISRTEDIAFNALLQAKASSAERRSIQMQFEIATGLHDFPLPSIDICRIISNIIDNGMYSAENYAGEKKLTISIKENVSHFIFQITNTGETIPKENMDRIFQARFTTKAEQGEGMGLYITKGIVEKYRGTISIKSENNVTEVTVLLPKRPLRHLRRVIV